MNEMISSTTKRNRLLRTASALAGLSLALGVCAAPATGASSLWLTADRVVDCAWTVTVNWADFKGAKTLEVFVTQTYDGVPLVASFVSAHKSGTATVTLAPLAPAATSDVFYAWAQLLDAHGVAIPSSLDFASPDVAYCTAP